MTTQARTVHKIVRGVIEPATMYNDRRVDSRRLKYTWITNDKLRTNLKAQQRADIKIQRMLREAGVDFYEAGWRVSKSQAWNMPYLSYVVKMPL